MAHVVALGNKLGIPLVADYAPWDEQCLVAVHFVPQDWMVALVLKAYEMKILMVSKAMGWYV